MKKIEQDPKSMNSSYQLKYFIPIFKETITWQKLYTVFKLHLSKCNWNFLSCAIHSTSYLSTVLKSHLSALKQKSISFRKTLSNVLWELLVYKVEKLKDEIEAVVVSMFISSALFMNGWSFKNVKNYKIYKLHIWIIDKCYVLSYCIYIYIYI